MTTATAGRLHDQLQRLSARNTTRLLTLWDRADSWDDQAQLAWHATAKPLALATAQAALSLTAAYAGPIEADPVPVPPLVIDDVGTHLFDPFDRLASRLAAGDQWTDAIASARSVVEAVAVDSVHAPSRTAMGYLLPRVTGYGRRLNPGACKWCMRFDGVVFTGSAEADFGHDNCKCQPFPVDELGDNNAQIREAAGFDDEAAVDWDHRKQRARLEKSIDTAKTRQAQAAREQLTERDPARLERLSIREQEWETRAEAATERLRILRTGTHRAAA